MTRIEVLVLVFLWFAHFNFAQEIVQSVAPESISAIVVRDLETGDNIRSYNADLLMVPASTAKIVTTITALNVLGSNYQFSTQIFANGSIKDSVLTGQLIIKGDGDPTLGSSFFNSTKPQLILKSIKESLLRAQIKKLEGTIIVNTAAIPEPRYPAGRLWEDMGNYYGSPPSGLSWRDNSFELDLSSPVEPGQLCRIINIRPNINGVEFVNYVLSANNQKDSAYIYGYPGLSKWEVRGTIPKNKQVFTIKGAIPNPALQFASELKAILSNNDNDSTISVIECQQSYNPNGAVLIHEIRSPFLFEIINVVNQRSHNLMADHLFLKLNNYTMLPGDNWTNASSTIIKYWQTMGVKGPIRLHDGSGLSPKNYIPPAFLVDLLVNINKSANNQVFESSLAIGGKSGTLARMWQKPEWNGRVIAKSGSMDGVMCYAGYFYSRTNKKYAFCIMVNHFITNPADLRKSIELEIGRLIDDL